MFSKSNIINPNNGNATSGWQGSSVLNLNNNITFLFQDNATYALNSVASPFARRFATKSSFEYCCSGFNSQSESFRRMVSDVLDVIELLFNYELNKKYLQIVNVSTNQLNFSGNKAFDNLIKQDQETELYFVVYNGAVIALSSYETLFYTNSRIGEWVKSNPSYFGNLSLTQSDSIPFDYNAAPKGITKRSKNFQEYLYHLKQQNPNTAIALFIDSELNNFIPQQNSNLWEPLVYDANKGDVKINGVTLGCSKAVQSQNLINNYLVQVKCSLNQSKFRTIKGYGYDNCLLPLNIKELNKADNPESFLSQVSCLSDKVSINQQYSKICSKLTPIELDMGIYPFFRYPERWFENRISTSEIFADSAYNVIVSYNKLSVPDSADLKIDFYYLDNGKYHEIPQIDSADNSSRLNLAKSKCVIVTKRTVEEVSDKNIFVTEHFSIIGANIDLIEVSANDHSGLIVPRMKDCPISHTTDQISFAVDFGTTTTYVAYKEKDNKITPFTSTPESMVFLHGKEEGDDIIKSRSFERTNSVETQPLINLIKNEFVPSGIDSNPYKFPIRTAMSVNPADKKNVLLGNCNIAFTYEHEESLGSNIFETNIKWDNKGVSYIGLFLSEIIKMCVNRAVDLGYPLNNISFIYFLPLSLDQESKEQMDKTWSELSHFYGFTYKAMTESLAPYYQVLTNKNGVDTKSVITIDVGGGSVDSSVFENNGIYKYSSSAKFGCDVLWGTPKSSMNDKENPIYLKFKDTVVSSNENLSNILRKMEEPNSPYSSKQIINFWITHEMCKDLYSQDLKPVYLAHLCAIVYHSAQLQKAEGGIIPAEVAFSGNGSTYLTKAFNKNQLNSIVSKIFEFVYDEHGHEIEVLLPNADVPGKQMTAFGGLNVPDSEITISDSSRIYRGTMLNLNDKAKDNAYFIENEDKIIDSICNNVEDYLSLLKKLLILCKDENDLSNHEYSSLIPNEKKRGIWKSNLKELIDQKKIVSSFFFSPIEQIIYDLENEILN